VSNVPPFVLMVAVVLLTAVSGLAQHKYYSRTVRRIARAYDEPGCVLVSGRGKSWFRGAVVVLVLRKDDQVIRMAAVMEGASVLARFKDRPEWVGRSAREDLPRCSPRAAAAVADALTHMPGRRGALPQGMRFAGSRWGASRGASGRAAAGGVRAGGAGSAARVGGADRPAVRADGAGGAVRADGPVRTGGRQVDTPR
jgi:glucitol operon activator protein